MPLILLGLSLAVLSIVGLVAGGASVLPPLWWLALTGIGCAVTASGFMLIKESS